jgi:arabinofuranosyltransferase
MKREASNRSLVRNMDWALIGLAALALVARVLPGPRTIDDAYITFRYTRNLVNGLGFVYNPGQHVQGTTTPLYTLLLAGLSLVFPGDYPLLALIVNALADACSVIVLGKLGERLAGSRAVGLTIGLLWAVAPMSVTFAIGGMETSLYVLLILLTFYSYATGNPAWSAFTCALALLTRPDALLVALPLFAHLLWVQRRVPWREGVILLLMLAPWVVFATIYFGNPLTNSVIAKTNAYRLGPYSAFIRLLQHYATPFFGQEFFGGRWPTIGLFLYPTLYLIGALALVRRDGRALPSAVFPGLYFVAFALPNPLIFRWYLAPPLPAYFLCIVVGGWTVVRDLTAAVIRRRARQASRGAALILACALLFLELNAWTLRPDHGPQRPAPEMAWFKLEELYRQAADVVLSHAAPGDTLCAGDIGVLGYRTGLHVFDTVGLVTPETARYYPTDPDIYVINYAIPSDLVLALDPDHIVILEVYGRRGLLPDPRFQAHYRLLEKIETDIYGSDGMLVFERRP